MRGKLAPTVSARFKETRSGPGSDTILILYWSPKHSEIMVEIEFIAEMSYINNSRRVGEDMLIVSGQIYQIR